MFENFPDILTVDDIKECLKVGKNRAYDLLKSKTIKSIKIGRKYIVPKIELIKYVINAVSADDNLPRKEE